MHKALIAAIVLLASGTTHAALVSKANVSVVGGLGCGFAINGVDFNSDFNEGPTSTLRVEYSIGQNTSVYGDYGQVSFNPIEGSQAEQVEVSSAAVGILLFGNLNTFGTVRAFLDLGASSNTVKGEDTEWAFRPGAGVDFEVSPWVGIRPSASWRRLAGDPERIDAIDVKMLLRITPWK